MNHSATILARRIKASALPALLQSLIAAAASFGEPADKLAENARALTMTACDGLVHSDVEPLLAQVLAGPMPRAANKALRDLQTLLPAGSGRTELTPADWRSALADWARALENGSCRATLVRADGDRAVLTARFETTLFDTGRKPWYWRFHYRASPKAIRLESVDLPFMGMTLARAVAERTFFERHKEEVKDDVAIPGKGRLVRNLIFIVAFLFIATLLLRRRREAGSRKGILRNKGFLIVLIVLMALLVYQLARRLTRPAPEKPPPVGSMNTLFADRILLKRRMIEEKYGVAEHLALNILDRTRAPDITVQLHLAEALLGQKKHRDALPVLEKLATAEDEVVRAFACNHLARLDMSLRSGAAAVKYLLALRKIVGDDDAILVRLARAFDRNGQSEEAALALKLALSKNPRSGAAILLRARFAVDRNDLEAAAADLRTLKKQYGLNIYRLRKDKDFARLKKDPRFADLFTDDAR